MMPVETTALIRCQGLEKVYSGGDTADVQALKRVDLEVDDGEFVILMGASGSGKSTLLYLLSGLERASDGEIQLGAAQIHQMNETELALLRRGSVGFVFQAINLLPHFTILENLLVPAFLLTKDRQSVRTRAQELLDSLGVGALLHRLPAQTSGGEQQRAAIARALINSPKVLFADEPTGALNSASGQTVLEAFQRISAAGQTIVMATHEVRAACQGDRVVYLRDGQICAEMRFSDSPRNSSGSLDIAARESQLSGWLSSHGW